MSEQHQLTFDDWPLAGSRPARARRTDPASSHEAVDRLEASGALTRQAQAVLALLAAHGTPDGITSRRLAQVAGEPTVDRYVAARRLVDLRRKGLAAREGDPGRPPHTTGDLRWWITGAGRELVA